MPKHSLEESFATLKQTIPLLLKHKIPAVPANYALWYTYVSNESPELKDIIDKALSSGETLSEVKTKDLSRTYLLDSQELQVWQLSQSLEAMLVELGQTMQDTRSDTTQFGQVLDKSVNSLRQAEQDGWSIKDVMSLIGKMVQEATAIGSSTEVFNGSLENAEREIERLKTQLQESQHDALYDALTGLCNRRYFDSEMESKQSMESLCVMMFDIDHFKSINDNHGHQMGDLVIKAVARKLQNGCRDSAQVFRYGGEEFAIIAPNVELARARHLADVMRRSIEKLSVKDRRSGETLGGITVSAGVAQLSESESVEDVVARADAQLYEAKRLGRNLVMPY